MRLGSRPFSTRLIYDSLDIVESILGEGRRLADKLHLAVETIWTDVR